MATRQPPIAAVEPKKEVARRTSLTEISLGGFLPSSLAILRNTTKSGCDSAATWRCAR